MILGRKWKYSFFRKDMPSFPHLFLLRSVQKWRATYRWMFYFQDTVPRKLTGSEQLRYTITLARSRRYAALNFNR